MFAHVHFSLIRLDIVSQGRNFKKYHRGDFHQIVKNTDLVFKHLVKKPFEKGDSGTVS